MARTRQLATIMFSGIDGYANLMQQDKKKAVELKERYQDIFYSIAGKYRAKILQNIRHESLSLFSSAVEAVECAIELQLALRKKAVLSVKIGIHLGDIIYSEEEALGEGIDVARRIKSQADPGGILISNKIHEEVKNQAGIESRFLKECELDVGGQMVEVYTITNEGISKIAPAGESRGGDIKVRLEDEKSIYGMPDRRSWFARHRVLRRYLAPVLVLGLFIVFYFFKDRIFQNWERVNKEAKAQTEAAMLFLNNNANPELIKQRLNLALEADPEYTPALHAFAQVHLEEGDTALAKQKLHKIVESNPGHSKAWDFLASFAFWQDSMELAMHYSTNAVETDPTNSTAACNMALQSEDRGLYQQAEVWYLKAIHMDSAFSEAYNALGALYNKLGRPTEAGIILRNTLRISPASPHNHRVYKNLAESHFILQEYVSAFEYLEKSKALKPDYPDTERCFALYYEARGYLQESIPHWKRYLTLETDTIEQLKAERHLDSLRSITP
jgi:class 3 adenylate cyclase/tetratricopeptide (TPR) repeat protein